MIVLITPTGARQNQFNLCSKWMQKQTYSGKVLWVIIDDAIPVTTENVGSDFRPEWAIMKVFPRPAWTGQNTQARNIKAGIDAVISNCDLKQIEAVFIIEDDDYYRPVYLQKMMSLIGKYSLIGETNTIYYNVVTRSFVRNPNTAHASLFQTAFTVDMIPVLESCYYHKFIDCVLWSKTLNKLLFFDNYLSIGMKGMPGRGGIGAGHSRSMRMEHDYDWSLLKRLIGEEDAKEYSGYYSDNRNTQHRLFNSQRI